MFSSEAGGEIKLKVHGVLTAKTQRNEAYVHMGFRQNNLDRIMPRVHESRNH